MFIIFQSCINLLRIKEVNKIDERVTRYVMSYDYVQ